MSFSGIGFKLISAQYTVATGSFTPNLQNNGVPLGVLGKLVTSSYIRVFSATDEEVEEAKSMWDAAEEQTRQMYEIFGIEYNAVNYDSVPYTNPNHPLRSIRARSMDISVIPLPYLTSSGTFHMNYKYAHTHQSGSIGNSNE